MGIYFQCYSVFILVMGKQKQNLGKNYCRNLFYYFGMDNISWWKMKIIDPKILSKMLLDLH